MNIVDALDKVASQASTVADAYDMGRELALSLARLTTKSAQYVDQQQLQDYFDSIEQERAARAKADRRKRWLRRLAMPVVALGGAAVGAGLGGRYGYRRGVDATSASVQAYLDNLEANQGPMPEIPDITTNAG